MKSVNSPQAMSLLSHAFCNIRYMRMYAAKYRDLEGCGDVRRDLPGISTTLLLSFALNYFAAELS